MREMRIVLNAERGGKVNEHCLLYVMYTYVGVCVWVAAFVCVHM